jgi:hypothetical protein
MLVIRRLTHLSLPEWISYWAVGENCVIHIYRTINTSLRSSLNQAGISFFANIKPKYAA